MGRDRFLDVSRARAALSTGAVDLPLLYRDATVTMAFFRVDVGAASRVLAAAPVAPVTFAGGRALAAFVAYDYRDTSIGAYREIAVTVAATPRGGAAPRLPSLEILRPSARASVGWWVIDLPVTTVAADVAGRELWGFPKFVAAIDVEAHPRRVRAEVRALATGEPIAVLEGVPGAGVSLPALDLVVYTARAGELLRTLIETRGAMRTGSGGDLRLRSGPADHPMARRLAALGLDGARPVAAQICTRYRSLLPAGVPVAVGTARAA
jgi:acetoacetate decarboxylase